MQSPFQCCRLFKIQKCVNKWTRSRFSICGWMSQAPRFQRRSPTKKQPHGFRSLATGHLRSLMVLLLYKLEPMHPHIKPMATEWVVSGSKRVDEIWGCKRAWCLLEHKKQVTVRYIASLWDRLALSPEALDGRGSSAKPAGPARVTGASAGLWRTSTQRNVIAQDLVQRSLCRSRGKCRRGGMKSWSVWAAVRSQRVSRLYTA